MMGQHSWSAVSYDASKKSVHTTSGTMHACSQQGGQQVAYCGELVAKLRTQDSILKTNA